MTSMTPDQIAAEWSQRLSGSTQKIQAGVAGVKAAPGQLAARQKAVYLANVQANVDKWATNVAAVPLSTWQADMVNKGIPRIGQGAQAAQSKVQQFFAQFLPFLNSAVASLPPRGTFEQNLARSQAMIRATHGFRRSGARG